MRFTLRARNYRDVFLHFLIIVATVVIIIMGFFYVYLPWYTNHGETVTVPDLSGMKHAELEDYLSERDLTYIVSDSVFEVGRTPLTVKSQYPTSGNQVKQGRRIYITLYALNPPKVKMPNLINRSVLNAEGELKSYGLVLGELRYVPDLQENAVLKQFFNGKEITEGAEVPKGSRIDLEVGDGLGQQELEVPDLAGMPQDEAELLLSGSNLQVGTVIYEKNPSVPEGSIIRQKPSAKSKIRVGDVVDLWISGEEPAAESEAVDEGGGGPENEKVDGEAKE